MELRLWAHPVSAKAGQAEARNVSLRCTQGRKVGENVPDHGRELEAMARAGRGNQDIWVAGQPVENEIAVRRHRIETGCGVGHRAVGCREMFGEKIADAVLVTGRDLAVAFVRVGDLFKMVML